MEVTGDFLIGRFSTHIYGQVAVLLLLIARSEILQINKVPNIISWEIRSFVGDTKHTVLN